MSERRSNIRRIGDPVQADKEPVWNGLTFGGDEPAAPLDANAVLARALDDCRRELRPLMQGEGKAAQTARTVWTALADASQALVLDDDAH